MSSYYMYILTNSGNNVLYVGMTDDLHRRWLEHLRKASQESFSARYNINKLVYYEAFQTSDEARAREIQLKAGRRQKKIDLIKSYNPFWNDLDEREFGWGLEF